MITINRGRPSSIAVLMCRASRVRWVGRAFLLAGWIVGSTATSCWAEIIRFDFNTATSPTQIGWIPAPNGNGSDGAVSVTTVGIGNATVSTRDRTGDLSPGGGDEPDMWRDFVFGNRSFTNGGSPTVDGLRVTVSGLEPATTYPVQIWGYDFRSNVQIRIADWSGGGDSETLEFIGSPFNNPVSLSDHTISFAASTDRSGRLNLIGTPSQGGGTGPFGHNVFINGLQIGDAIPEPSTGVAAVIAVSILALRRRWPR